MTEQNFTHEFAATSGVQDFKLRGLGEPPAAYPVVPVPDTYSKTVFAATFSERRQHFIEHVLRNPGVDTVKGFFYELIRIQEGTGPIHDQMLFSALDYINQRYDCADFVLAGVLRVYHQLLDSHLLSDDFREQAKACILGFKYWPDEPGIDSMCFWTENHHIIFSSNEYLAGQLFPEEVFTNSGMPGKEKQARACKRIEKWLELRFYTGFNEWLSNVYYDEDFPPLLNLLDFAEDIELGRRSHLVIDLMLYDMAINSYYGQFACTHGRTYTREKLNPYQESTTDTAKLMFGLGSFANQDNMSAVFFALSESYVLPEVIQKIAADGSREEWVNQQRVSIRFKDAAKWGYGEMNLESAMGLLSFGGYCHPRTFNHMVLMLDEFRWWDNQFFLEFAPHKKMIQFGRHIGLTNLVAWVLRKDMSRNSLEECNIYTFRTPDYMLSTAQDYRKSYGGDQHHIWQATLDDEAVCFTTHPGGYGLKAPDAYWHGNGFMPRALQHRNVAVIIYNTPRTPNVVLQQTLEFTHAFFPRDRFDKVVEQSGWVFGEKAGGYIALRSQRAYDWAQESEYAGEELIAPGRKNIWLVEMGRRADFGSFDEFIRQISAADLTFKGLTVRYQSPSLGLVETGWRGAFKVNGQQQAINNYPRYQNPSCTAEFGADEINIHYKGEDLQLKY